MTVDELAEVFRSKPRARVVRIVARWLLLAFLTPVKMILRLPALPFLWLSNRLYDCARAPMCDVGDIRLEREEREIREANQESEDDEWT